MRTVIHCLCLTSLLTYALVIMYNRLRTEMCQLNVDLEHRCMETAINIVVLGEFQSLIEIDANRNVLCDFNN
jgi:hypothetical protein